MCSGNFQNNKFLKVRFSEFLKWKFQNKISKNNAMATIMVFNFIILSYKWLCYVYWILLWNLDFLVNLLEYIIIYCKLVFLIKFSLNKLLKKNVENEYDDEDI